MLKGSSIVLMMETAEIGAGHDATHDRRLDWTGDRRVVVQGKMSPRAVVVGDIRHEDAPQMPFVQHDDVVQAFPPDRADQPFHVGILPGRARRRASVRDAETGDAAGDDGVDEEPIAIM
jgi:hypothetical protein